MATLTDRQSAVLKFISSQSRRGRVPTVREISEHMKMTSPNGAMNHLIALERKGFIRMPHDGKSRGIHVVGQTRRRSDIEQQLYDALGRCIAFIDQVQRGDMPLRNEYERVTEQAYEAINAADDTKEEGHA